MKDYRINSKRYVAIFERVYDTEVPGWHFEQFNTAEEAKETAEFYNWLIDSKEVKEYITYDAKIVLDYFEYFSAHKNHLIKSQACIFADETIRLYAIKMMKNNIEFEAGKKAGIAQVLQELYDHTFEGKEENPDESIRIITREYLLWYAQDCCVQIDE